MYDINLLYDNWYLNKPIPNCLNSDIFNYIKLNEDIINTEMHIVSFNIEEKFGNKHNMWMSNLGCKVELPKVQYNTDNWVYPIEPWGHIMYSLNLDGIDDYYNFFRLIPKSVIESVNNGVGKIVINYTHEGWVSDFLLKGMYIGCKNTGIQLDRIILILNDYNLENKIKKFKKEYNISNYLTTINYSYYLTTSAKHFYNKHKDSNLHTKHINIFKPYKFLCLNRRLDLHRVVLLSEIFDDIESESLISFDKTLVTNEISSLFIQRPDIEAKFNNLPEKVVADRLDIKNTNGYEHENETLFLDSYISIVTETSFYVDNDFISEKIWKPLYQFHPFIVVGRPHLLKYLREIGFKTFDWIIDERYDEVEDNDLRMEMIINEIKKLNKLSLSDIEVLINENFSKLEHNHNLLNSIGKDTESIEKFMIENVKNNSYSYIDIFKEVKL